MKIKVSYGIDMRLWRYNGNEERPELATYQNLLSFICDSFGFSDPDQFAVEFDNEDGNLRGVNTLHQFQDAFISAQERNLKSLKLRITAVSDDDTTTPDDEAENQPGQMEIDEKDKDLDKEEANNDPDMPSKEDIDAFLGDETMIALLTDLLVAVFQALHTSQFEMTFLECMQGILLSDVEKYAKLVGSSDQDKPNKCWSFFMKDVLPRFKIEHFVFRMIRMQGNTDTEMLRMWIPSILKMVRYRLCSEDFDLHRMWRCGRHGRHGRRGRRGRIHGHRHGHHGHHHGHGHHGHGHGHHGHGHRHGHHGHGPHHGPGHHGHGHRHHGLGHRHHHGHHEHGPHHHAHGGKHHGGRGRCRGRGRRGHQGPRFPIRLGVEFPLPQDQVPQPEKEEQIEKEQPVFSYDQELVEIMNMGFADLPKIKQLLIEHQGNKQTVVQQLVN